MTLAGMDISTRRSTRLVLTLPPAAVDELRTRAERSFRTPRAEALRVLLGGLDLLDRESSPRVVPLPGRRA